MHSENERPPKSASAGAARRAERLAVELRANLGRRKLRARKVAATEREASGRDDGGGGTDEKQSDVAE